MKKLINEIVVDESKASSEGSSLADIAKSKSEVQFFSHLRRELRKSSQFFKNAEIEYKIRWERIWEGYLMLKDTSVLHDQNSWARLLAACVKFYKDVLLLENFAIMNYCGFSKILKKRDKKNSKYFIYVEIEC